MDEVHLAHTATKLADARGKVVVCGSHGGRYPGELAVAAGVRAILFNDAGVGLDAAGIAGLLVCEQAGIPAASLAHTSCRIGNAPDALARGVVSYANTAATELGVASGMDVPVAAETLAAAPLPRAVTPSLGEHRSEATRGGWRVVICDSASLVSPYDDEAIVITASHGGLVGDDPASAGRAEARLFAFNDAGGGIDAAGLSRLPVLDSRGIAAVTVDCQSARIGEGRSTLSDGRVSHVNAAAARLGAKPGEPLADLVAELTATPPR